MLQRLGPKPSRLDFTYWFGSTAEPQVITITFVGEPLNLTNYEFIQTITLQSRSKLIRTVGDGLTIVDAAGGVLSIDGFSPEETRLLHQAQYELEIRPIGGAQSTWLYGQYIGAGGLNDD